MRLVLLRYSANVVSVFPWVITTAISHIVVELPNAALVTYVGTIKHSPHITLTNVLCVPSFSFNLISISALTHSHPLCLVFLSTYCFIQDLICWNTIGMGQMHDGLYLLQGSSLSIASKSLDEFLLKHKFKSFIAFSSSVSYANLYSLWHSRLGHPSDVKLHSLSHLFPFLQNCCTKDCNVCILAKQKRLPFPFYNKRAIHSFDLVHMDVWGPFSVPTTARHRYFLTIVDNASRATWIFLLRAKSEVRPLITSFYNMVHAQFNTSIKSIRIDNALEFNMVDFYSSKGIIHQQSYVSLHNKIQLWKGNISTFWLLLEPYRFCPISLLFSRVIVSS